jgi:hypothetical protein
MTKKQETILASFGRQRKPFVHRLKSSTMSTSFNSRQPFVAVEENNDIDDIDAIDDDHHHHHEGMETDVDVFSSQETYASISQEDPAFQSQQSQVDSSSNTTTDDLMIPFKKQKTNLSAQPLQLLSSPRSSTVPLHKKKVVSIRRKLTMLPYPNVIMCNITVYVHLYKYYTFYCNKIL